jgi:hypothetical protein
VAPLNHKQTPPLLWRTRNERIKKISWITAGLVAASVESFCFRKSPTPMSLILWFSEHSRTGRGISLVLPWFEADNYCGSRGTVRVPMLVRILRTYQLPEILMLAAATLCVVVGVVAY